MIFQPYLARLLSFALLLIVSACGGGSDEGGGSNGEPSPSPQPAPNQAPFVSAGEDIDEFEQNMIELTGTSSDSDGEVVQVSWEQLSGPTIELNNASSLVANFNAPATTTETTIILRITATDDQGASASDQITVRILPVNLDPVAEAGEDFSINEQLNTELKGRGEDNDGTIDAYSWQQLGGPSVEISGTDQLRASFIAPTVTGNTDLVFEFSVTDNEGARSSDQITVRILPVNLDPVAEAGEDFSINEQLNTELQGRGDDNDGTIDAYSWQQLSGPSVEISGADQLRASFIAPTVTGNTDLVFEFSVTDNEGARSSDQITVRILPVNLDPVAEAGEDFSINEQLNTELRGRGEDNDGTIDAYSWQQLSGASVEISGADQLRASFIAPTVTESTDLVFEFSVTDNEGASTSDQITVRIVPVNAAPVADAGEDFSVDENAIALLSGVGEDEDGLVETFTWRQLDGPSVTITNADQADAQFTAPSLDTAAVLTFELALTDNEGASSSDQIKVTVEPLFEVNMTFPSTDHGPYKGSYIDVTGVLDNARGNVESTTVTVNGGGNQSIATVAADGFWRTEDVELVTDESGIALLTINAEDETGNLANATRSLDMRPALSRQRGFAYLAGKVYSFSDKEQTLVSIDINTAIRVIVWDGTRASGAGLEDARNLFDLAAWTGDENMILQLRTNAILSTDPVSGETRVISDDRHKGDGPTLGFAHTFSVDSESSLAYVGVSQVIDGTWIYKVMTVDLNSGDREMLFDTTDDSYVAFKSFSDFAYDSSTGLLYIADDRDSSIYSLDTESLALKIVSSSSVGAGNTDILGQGSVSLNLVDRNGETVMIVSNVNTNGVYEIDLTSGDRSALWEPFPQGVENTGARDTVFAPETREIIFGDQFVDGSIAAINIDDLGARQLSSGRVGDGSNIQLIRQMHKDSNTNRLIYTQNGFPGGIFEIDIDSGTRTQLISIGSIESSELSSSGNEMYLSQGYAFDENTFYRYDLSTGQRAIVSSELIGSGPSFGSAYSFTLSDDEESAYVVRPERNDVLMVNLMTGDREIIASSVVGTGTPIESIRDIEFDGVNNRLILLLDNFSESSLLALELDSLQREELMDITALNANLNATSIKLDDLGRLYLFGDVSFDSKKIFRVNLSDNELTTISGSERGGGFVFPDTGSGADSSLNIDTVTERAFVSTFSEINTVDLTSGDRQVIAR